MTATAEGTVDIDAFRLDLQTVQRFVKKHGYMIISACLSVAARHHHCESPPGFITCLARLLNASGEKDSKNCWYLLLSQISILSTAATSTISFSRPACSFRFCGINNLPAESNSAIVAPFRKYLLNCRTSGSKSFNWLILVKMGSQLFIG